MNGATVELVLLLLVVLLFLLLLECVRVWGGGEGGGGTKLHLEGLNKAQHFEGELAALVEQTLQTGTQQQQQQPSTHSLHKRFQVNYFLGYCIVQFSFYFCIPLSALHGVGLYLSLLQSLCEAIF